MNFTSKLKETATSVVPVIAIVLVLAFTVAPIGAMLIIRFVIGGVLLIFGLAAFLLGVDIGIQPIGEQTGAALTSKKNVFLLLAVSFAIGFLVTVAEPDIQVFGDQIHSVFNAVEKMRLVFMIAFGVGVFIVFGLLRTVLHLPIKIVLLIFYAVIFGVAFLAPASFRGIAIDSGGATTGPMTVPFILALGVGVAAVRSKRGKSDDDDTFGLTGITSMGPILAVLLYGVILLKSGASLEAAVSSAESASEVGLNVFIKLIPVVAKEATLSIAPLVVMLIVFQFTLLKLPPHQIIRMAVGLVWSYIGLTIFLIGVNGGFMSAGRELGGILGQKASQEGGMWIVLLIFTGLLLGAVVVCAEPAVWVLTDQVENLSGGTIKRKFMLSFLAVGAAVAVGLALWRTFQNFSIMKILVPGYAIALFLMIFSPSLFTAIAFDSGGVASGPITSTFILSFAIGASQGCGGNGDSFGVIALVAMTPLIAIQLLGIVYNAKKKRSGKISEKSEVKNGCV